MNGPSSDAARGLSLDPHRTFDRLDLCRKIAYAWAESIGGMTGNAAARAHYAYRRGGGVAAGRARTAASRASIPDWIPHHLFPGANAPFICGVRRGPTEPRLSRWRECRHRVSLRRRQIGTAARACSSLVPPPLGPLLPPDQHT